MNPSPFKVIGHRGACGYVPENTIESFEKAIALGVKWVEFDVHFSHDGVPMVIHDATLSRTTNLKGNVRDLDADEMMHPIGKAGHAVPTLKEVLTLLGADSIGAYVEIKSYPKEGLSGVLTMLGQSQSSCILSSFNQSWLSEARKIDPNLPIQALLSKPPKTKPLWLDELAPIEIGVGFSFLSKKSAARMISWGYPVLAYTVNEDHDLLSARDMNLSGVFTNFPDKALNLGL